MSTAPHPALGAVLRVRPAHFAAALAALVVLVYLAPLGVRPLDSPDEVRYASIAREMIASGDWVSPRFDGVRYFEKPPLGYWLTAASFEVLGENAFALRLPVAIATLLTALIVGALARRFVSPFAARLAPSVFLTTALVSCVGTFAVLDAYLALFLTAALAAWYMATLEPPGRRRVLYLALCGCACGAAFLVKGFLAWAIPVIVAVPHLGWRRQWRALVTLPWIPIAAAAAIALPWAVLMHLREPDFWRYFFWVEHVQRFAGDEAQHARPPWFFLEFLPLIGWPWILTLPAAAIGLRGPPRDDFGRYLLLWVVMPFLFFSIARGKLLTYVLPCFAPLSILIAAGLERYFASDGRRAFRAAAGVAALLFAAALAGLVVAQRGIAGAPLYSASEPPKLVALAAMLAAGAGGAVLAYRTRSVSARLFGIAAAGVAALLPLQFAMPERVIEQAVPAVAVARYAHATPDTIVVADASLAGTAVWVLARSDVYVVDAGELAYGMSYPEARYRDLSGRMLEQLVAANRGRADILLILKRGSEAAFTPRLPPGTVRAEHGLVVLLRIPRMPRDG
ncbi:MAG TPA: phospholipid carrier-dependent glycosyltransferase [Gammaproteobacteria bacterium]|nr:phospholipid carrier-dependent glycosyltransferase [Gammaproteobacteria bacterium]